MCASNSRFQSFALLLALTSGLCAWLSSHALAATPNLLRCNARVSAAGQLFTGTGRWKVVLLDGSGASLWSHDGTSVNGQAPASFFTAAVLKGQTTLLLGDAGMTALPSAAFTQSGLKLRLWFSDGSRGFQQLVPDQIVQPVPMALITAQADAPADGAVQAASFATGAVQSSHLAAGAVSGAALAAGAVTNAQLTPNAVKQSLNASGAGVLPKGSVILSATESNSALSAAGFAKQGNLGSEPGWVTMPPAFWSRSNHLSAWNGTEVMVWGGDQGSLETNPSEGAPWLWNPTTGIWRMGASNMTLPMPAPAYPSSREWYSMGVWTGSLWLIWNHSQGAAYNPATDTWTPMSTIGAPSPRWASAVVWTGTEMLIWGGILDLSGLPRAADGAAYNPVSNTWRSLATIGAPAARAECATVWTGTEMIVWGGNNGYTAAGGRYNPTTDTWTPMPTAGGPVYDYKSSSAVWTGTEMLIAQGDSTADTSQGWRYNPTTNLWTAMSTTNAPSPRRQAASAWTGTELIVWGGYNYFVSGQVMADGARYNPTTDTWTPMSAIGAPDARYLCTGVWTGSRFFIYGGSRASTLPDPFAPLDDAFNYDPVTNTWAVATTPGSPPEPASNAVSVWTGTEWIISGGFGATPIAGSRYNPVTRTWNALPTNTIGERYRHSAVWTGTELIVFGGYHLGGASNQTWRWVEGETNWRSVNPPSLPPARYDHQAVWTGSKMIIFGGRESGGGILDDPGWSYDPVTVTWTALPTLNGPSSRTDHFMCWTGSKVLVWGGTVTGNGTLDGGLYDPATVSWTPITPANAPLNILYTSAVWTGTELIVWGGGDLDSPVNTGARYNPSTNTWTSMSTAGAPSARYQHSAVWDGSRMIVWGGHSPRLTTNQWLNDGAIYDPILNVWLPLTSSNAPPPRFQHHATWAGDRMLILGGEGGPGPLSSKLDDMGELNPSISRWFYVKQ